MEMAGRVAVLTGATRVGATVAATLAARGVDVALGYHRSAARAEATVRVIEALGRRAIAVQADLTRPAACRDLIAQAARALGRLDVLVAMASVYARVPYDALTEADWGAPLAVDLSSAFHCAHAAAPHMRAAGGGRIILCSDWIAPSGRPRYRGYLPYYVAKAGVVALGEALALELAADGILVNTIAPGPVLPPDALDAAAREAVTRATPLGHWGGPHVVAQAVVSLIDSDFITGQTLRIDGGRHLS